MEKFLTCRTIELLPGAVKREEISFTRFVVTEASFGIKARFGESGEESDLQLGFKLDFDPVIYPVITFRNPHTTDTCYLTYIAGTGNFTDNRFNIVTTRPNQFVQFGEAPTTVQPCATTSLAAGAVLEFTGVLTGKGNRKALYVSNADPVEFLYVYSGGTKGGGTTTNGVWSGGTYTGGTCCGFVPPQTTHVFETSDVIAIKNASAVPLTLYSFETYLARPLGS